MFHRVLLTVRLLPQRWLGRNSRPEQVEIRLGVAALALHELWLVDEALDGPIAPDSRRPCSHRLQNLFGSAVERHTTVVAGVAALSIIRRDSRPGSLGPCSQIPEPSKVCLSILGETMLTEARTRCPVGTGVRRATGPM